MSLSVHTSLTAIVIFILVVLSRYELCEAQTTVGDVKALKAIFEPLGFSNWKTKTNWDFASDGSDMCGNDPTKKWFGISCTAGRVTAISLPGNYLVGGPIDSDSLAKMDKLGALDISNNYVSGFVPASLQALVAGKPDANVNYKLGGNVFYCPLPQWVIDALLLTATDCVCPFGFDRNYATDGCWNGECNKATGTCSCYDGYKGLTCKYGWCPGSKIGVECSGNGRCDRLSLRCTCDPETWTGVACDNQTFFPMSCTRSDLQVKTGSVDAKTGQCNCLNTGPDKYRIVWQPPHCQRAHCPGYLASTQSGVEALQCSGHGECNPTTGKCTCYDLWYTDDCSVSKCPNDCSNHGTCNEKTGECVCNDKWMAPDCLYSRCGGENCIDGKVATQMSDYISGSCTVCNGHGQCDSTTGACVCTNLWVPKPGKVNPSDVYSGSNDCKFSRCRNDCWGQGTCDKTTGKCTCMNQWGIDASDSSGGGQFNDCSVAACPLGCSGQGTCDSEVGRCTCKPGYYGDACQYKRCPGPLPGEESECWGHGKCDKISGKCLCTDGWSGPDCQTANCPQNCNMYDRHGFCNIVGDGMCNCKSSQYKSPDCRLVECLNQCSGHGKCDSLTGRCACDSKYSSDDSCYKATCPAEARVIVTQSDGSLKLVDCYGNGKCDFVLGTCSCNGLFDPLTNCKVSACPNNCNGRGYCNTSTGVCGCYTIFGGDDCSDIGGVAMGLMLAGAITLIVIVMTHIGMSFYSQYVKTSDNAEETTLMLASGKGE